MDDSLTLDDVAKVHSKLTKTAPRAAELGERLGQAFKGRGSTVSSYYLVFGASRNETNLAGHSGSFQE